MPKMKTKAGAKKRFKVTGSGKLKRKHAFKSHILTKKETKQKRNLTKSGLVHKSDVKSVKLQLCMQTQVINQVFSQTSALKKAANYQKTKTKCQNQ